MYSPCIVFHWFGPGIAITNTMKFWISLLVDDHFLTWILIGWQPYCQPIKSHTIKLMSAKSNFNRDSYLVHTVKPLIQVTHWSARNLLITQMQLEHRLSALPQLHLYSPLYTWLQWIGQRQQQDEMIIIYVLGFGALILDIYGNWN